MDQKVSALSLKGYWTVPKAGVYLVFDENYQVVGVASGDRAAYTMYGKQAVRVLGPVEVNKPIDWDATQEERYGVDFGHAGQYATLKDGVPAPPVLEGIYEIAYPNYKKRRK